MNLWLALSLFVFAGSFFWIRYCMTPMQRFKVRLGWWDSETNRLWFVGLTFVISGFSLLTAASVWVYYHAP